MVQPNQSDLFEEGLRVAAVLVVELDGGEALVEHPDVQAAGDLLREIWLHIDRTIAGHGGVRIGRTGAAAAAVWAAPAGSGDDAERAVDCALALHASFESLASGGEGAGLSLRIGIESGPVLAVALDVSAERAVVGEALRAAGRLAGQAEAGSVLIGQSAYRQVRGAFAMRPLAGSVPAYRVDKKLDHPLRARYRSGPSLETRIVGRDAEIQDLHDQLDSLRLRAAPQLSLLVGAPGMGKSRLLMEFSTQAEALHPDANLIFVRGQVEAEKAPYFFWKTLWKDRFAISDNQPDEAACELFLRGVLHAWGKRLGRFSAVEAAHLVGDLIGLHWKDSPYLRKDAEDLADRHRRAFELARELFVRTADSGPIVLMVDDMQHVDPGSLDLLHFLMQPGEDALPMLVLGSVTPDFCTRNPLWERRAHRLYRLDPLEFSIEMVRRAYPALAHFPDPLLARMAERSGGSPLFLEEMAKSLLRVGRAEADARPPRPSLAQPLPEDLRALLHSRLEDLPRAAREVLLLASVAGRSFWLGAVRAAARQPVGTGLLNLPVEVLDRTIQEALQHIVRAELAFPRAGSIFEGEQEFIFKHQLVQQAAYEAVPTKYLKFYHIAVAKWLSERAGQDFSVMIAGHFELAGNVSSALRYYQFALNFAQMRGVAAEVARLEARMRAIRHGEAAVETG